MHAALGKGLAMNNEVGVLVSIHDGKADFTQLAQLKLKVCSVVSWDPAQWTDAIAARLTADAASSGVKITSFWAGYPGPAVWDFIQGPTTIGLVPQEYRAMRVDVLKKAGGFAKKLGVPAVITHLGFIPENAGDPVLADVVAAVKDIALHYQTLGLEFWFETGQETPVALLRLIQLVGTKNLGINLDPANLILYGRGSAVDSIDVFGTWVKNVHAKDGMYPTDPMKLGHEVKVGDGRVRFPELLKRLNDVGFKGELIIEREISGEQQKKDIAETVGNLRAWMAKI
jgi:L-ribulose-5-phosphate 3-epimerase